MWSWRCPQWLDHRPCKWSTKRYVPNPPGSQTRKNYFRGDQGKLGYNKLLATEVQIAEDALFKPRPTRIKSTLENGRNTTASEDAWMLIACLPCNSSLYASVQSAHRSIELRCRNSNDWHKLVFYEIYRLESVSSHCTISKNAVGVVTWKWLCRPIPGQCRLLQCKDNPGCVWLSRNFDPILRCEVFSWIRARIWCFNSWNDINLE